jgi:hypothetical protein
MFRGKRDKAWRSSFLFMRHPLIYGALIVSCSAYAFVGCFYLTLTYLSRVSIHALHTEGVRHLNEEKPYLRLSFNSRAPYEVRPGGLQRTLTREIVSIHALHTECDRRYIAGEQISHEFQSTHSIWSATTASESNLLPHLVSIHALHMECDSNKHPKQSRKVVSIHALHMECDMRSPLSYFFITCFNPRTPYGVRLLAPYTFCFFQKVSIHALHMECDLLVLPSFISSVVSIHALHMECDWPSNLCRAGNWVSIHALHMECDSENL